MLVHICCSVDSHYFLQKLQECYPQERLIGFFYDPNIHPYSEYTLRLLDVKRSCRMLGVELIEGEYDTQRWLEAVRGLEQEPEKGARCSVCFDRRFEVTAQKAHALGEATFTSTLLTSPKKSLQQLQKAGERLATTYGVRFVAPDFRKASGTQEQNLLAKHDALYRQDYCGCLFGLRMQRDQQQRLTDELFSPLTQQILPESIESRLALYEKRTDYESQGRAYKIVKQRFLNWRLTSGLLRVRKVVVPAHFLPYATLRGEYSRGKIEYQTGELYHMNRDEVKFITLSTYNQQMQTAYPTIEALLLSPPTFEEEVALLGRLGLSTYSLSTLLVVATIPEGKIELLCQSHTYEDVKEVLVDL